MHTTSASPLEHLRLPGARAAWERFVDLYTPLLFSSFVWGLLSVSAGLTCCLASSAFGREGPKAGKSNLQVLSVQAVTSLATPNLSSAMTHLVILKRFQDAFARISTDPETLVADWQGRQDRTYSVRYRLSGRKLIRKGE